MHEIDEADWFMIGLKFGLGFMIVVAAFSFVGWLITISALEYNLKVTADAIKHVGADAERTAQQLLPTAHAGASTIAMPQHGTRQVTVAPKDHATCLAESSGRYDDSYLKCIRGFSYAETY